MLKKLINLILKMMVHAAILKAHDQLLDFSNHNLSAVHKVTNLLSVL